MVELLVSIALMSVMTAVLLQSFIVARRINARTSTEQKLQVLAKTTMESLEAADLSERQLREAALDKGSITIDGIKYKIEKDSDVYRLLYNDVGNGRGPVVSFGSQYGVWCTVDPTPYEENSRATGASGSEVVKTFNKWDQSKYFPEKKRLVKLSVVVFRMEEHLSKDGPEQMRYESARFIDGGAS